MGRVELDGTDIEYLDAILHELQARTDDRETLRHLRRIRRRLAKAHPSTLCRKCGSRPRRGNTPYCKPCTEQERRLRHRTGPPTRNQ